ncbi:uncharacterized protein LTR77_004014 [Saxophila tyrrhenica]|uniref:Uncharacterized protein n=1 Tax=Saxophila tyrrhenica TaxID=1690608 RepID=A0AAV9PFX5_9PEZI|nr:hypothetical protein LTR77_004014 [Saxophila tyrrhenica]
MYSQPSGTWAGGDPHLEIDQWLLGSSLDPTSEQWLQGLVEDVPNQSWSPFAPYNDLSTALDARESPPPPKRRRGRLYKCDGRRPVCANCERSRRHTCHGFNRTGSPASARDYFNVEARVPNTGSKARVTAAPASVQRDYGRLFYVTTPPAAYDGNHVAGMTEEDRGSDSVNHPRKSINEQTTGYIGEDDPGLLRHYQSVVSPFLMPTIDPSRNPYLQIYLPLATHHRPSRFTAALHHALLCVAGSHMQQIENTRAHLRRDTEAHGKEAEKLILEATGHLARQSDDNKYTLLAAALSMLQADVFGGETLRCDAHLDLARNTAERAGGPEFWQSSATARTLYQMFKCYVVIATTAKVANRHLGVTANIAALPFQASNPIVSEGQHEAEERDYDQTVTFPSTAEYNLDISFGISLRTISHLHRALQIERQLVNEDVSERELDLLPTSIDALRSELFAVERDKAAFASKGDDSSASSFSGATPEARMGGSPINGVQASLPPVIRDELAENHQWAFHYAVIVFFGRILARSGLDNLSGPEHRHGELRGDLDQSHELPAPGATYQTLVGRVFDHLENIDALTKGSSVQPANTLWPVFIAAAEAFDVQLRRRALILFNRASKRGIGNIARAKELAMEVWRRVDRQTDADGSLCGVTSGLGPVDWRSVMKEMGCSIMLT